MANRTNFTEMQKAQIYARDRAICVYTGITLWMLDRGADPDWRGARIDHVVPSARGGPSTLENGVCCDAEENFNKRDKSAQPFLLRAGKPTEHFDKKSKEEQELIFAALARFERLHYSDYFFNKAIENLLFGLHSCFAGSILKARGRHFWANSTHQSIKKWQTVTHKDTVPSLEDRGLVPDDPSQDQQLMLNLRVCKSPAEVYAILLALVAYFQTNCDFRDDLDRASTVEEILGLAEDAAQNLHVSPRIRNEIHVRGKALASKRGANWISPTSSISNADVEREARFLLSWGHAHSSLLAGRLNNDNGSFETAIRHCNDALHLDSICVDVLLVRANAYLEINGLTKAIADCTRGIQLAPDNPESYLVRSKAYSLLGNRKAADADREKARKIDPDCIQDLEDELAMPEAILAEVQGRSTLFHLQQNPVMLKLKDNLDQLSMKLNVAKLSDFYDRSEPDETNNDAEAQASWFDPVPALVALEKIHKHLVEYPNLLGFKPNAAQKHWPDLLTDELVHCIAALKKAVSRGRKFRFLIVR